MIATIRAEWRKNRFRPAFLVSLGVVAASTVFVYGIVWYLATHPSPGNQQGVSLLTLYPDQFVNYVMGIGLLLGEAMAVVLGAVLAVEVLGVRFIDSLNNGAYKWIGNLFVGQNATALLQSFTSPAFGPSLPPAIATNQAVLVLGVYFVGLIVVAAGLLRLRDVT